MNNSIRAELKAHLLGMINDEVLTDDNRNDWHFYAFNEDYYIIGYYNGQEWLKRHGVDAFEAIDTIVQYEQDNFGETTASVANAESVVNMYVYILGEELLSDIDADDIEELREGVE
jgi:hypothetical protein